MDESAILGKTALVQIALDFASCNVSVAAFIPNDTLIQRPPIQIDYKNLSSKIVLNTNEYIQLSPMLSAGERTLRETYRSNEYIWEMYFIGERAQRARHS